MASTSLSTNSITANGALSPYLNPAFTILVYPPDLFSYLFDRVFKPTQSSKKTFLINERKKISYKEFHFIVNKIANYLVDINLAPGDRVAVQAEKNIIPVSYTHLRAHET